MEPIHWMMIFSLAAIMAAYIWKDGQWQRLKHENELLLAENQFLVRTLMELNQDDMAA